MGALQAPAHEPPTQPVLVPGALRKGRDHGSRFTLSVLELEIRGMCALLHLQVAGEQSKHVGGVLRPAWHAQVEFTDPLVAVLQEEARQALLQGSRVPSYMIHLGKTPDWRRFYHQHEA